MRGHDVGTYDYEWFQEQVKQTMDLERETRLSRFHDLVVAHRTDDKAIKDHMKFLEGK